MSEHRTIVADPPWLPTMALVNSPASGIGASNEQKFHTGDLVHIDEGDIFTISGVFKNRSFWDWLTRRPRQLAQFTVLQKVPSNAP